MFFENFEMLNIPSCNEKSIFEMDVNSIHDINVIKNTLDKMNFELETFRYSDEANCIAEFYEKCKKTTGMMTFWSNNVVKFILEEIEYMPSLKKYLNERMLNYMKQDRVSELNKCFELDYNEIKKKQEQKKPRYYVNRKAGIMYRVENCE